MHAISYRHQLDLLHKPRTYRLTKDGLLWQEDGGAEMRLPFAEIREVRMAHRPERFHANFYRTMITPRKGRKLSITNCSLSGFGNVEDHSAEYSAFIRELHRRLVASGARIAFRKGSTSLGYVGNLLLVVFIFAGLAFLVYWRTGHDMQWFQDIGFYNALLSLPILYLFMRSARPGRYDPLNPATDSMPKEATPPPQ